MTALLTDQDVAAMKTAQESNLPETVYIQRLTRISDEAGGWDESWQTVATTNGRVGEPSGRELELAGAIGTIYAHIVTLPSDTELLETDQLQINATQYRINVILRRSQKTALRILVTEV